MIFPSARRSSSQTAMSPEMGNFGNAKAERQPKEGLSKIKHFPLSRDTTPVNQSPPRLSDRHDILASQHVPESFIGVWACRVIPSLSPSILYLGLSLRNLSPGSVPSQKELVSRLGPIEQATNHPGIHYCALEGG